VAAAGPDIAVGSAISDARPDANSLRLTELAPDLKVPQGQATAGVDLSSIRTKLSLDGLGWLPASLEWVEATIRDIYKIDLRSRDPGGALVQPTSLVTPNSTLVVSQTANAKDLQTGWKSKLVPDVVSSTVIVAPTAEALRASTEDLVTSAAWQQLTGLAMAYDREAASMRTLEADVTWFIPTQPLMPANVRLIVAGWLSKNVLFYLAVLFAAVVVLAGMTYRLVRVSGARES